MDSFKEMAEEKMREAVSQQIQGEIDADENELRARTGIQFLQATDTRPRIAEDEAVHFRSSPSRFWRWRHGPLGTWCSA